jgi:plastocyanin
MRIRPFTAILVALTTAAALSACGRASTHTTSGAAPASAACPASVHFNGAVNDHGTGPAIGGTITAGDSFFSPTCISGESGGPVTLKITNTGSMLHSFTLPDGSVDKDVAPGQTITVTVNLGTSPLLFYCKYHRTSGMVGAVIPSS